MRITWLLENADQLWGGVKVALTDANWLHDQGHQVVVLSRSGPPSWMQLRCSFRRVVDFRPEHLPEADVIVGTFWTTVPWAAAAGPGKGVPVHYCQGYEGDNPENTALRDRIEAVYRLPGVRHVTIAPHLTRLLHERFGAAATQVVYAIDHAVHHPGPARPANQPLRVGLVGPYQIAWKDLATGFAACRLAHAAGQPLVLVRATNTRPDPAEQDTPFPVEWHQQLPPERMGDFYRSLDVFLGTSSGPEEGFFLPAVEAMACGVPTVLTDIPCFRSHGSGRGEDRYALFVPPRDAAAMAEALVLAGRVDEVRDALRHHGLQAAARYTQDAHGRALLAAFAGFVAAAGRDATPAPAAARGERHPLRLVAAAPAPAAPLAATPAPAPAPRPPAAAAAPNPPAGPSRPGAAVLQEHAGRLRTAAQGLLRDGDAATAAQLLAAAACLLPRDAQLPRDLAAARHRAGDLTGALGALDDLLRRGADDAPLQTSRGELLHALGRTAEAAQAFRAALALGPRTADAYNRLGVVLFEAGDVAGARQSFERALVLQPGHADASANLAALPAA